jgi:hypothetical protein
VTPYYYEIITFDVPGIIMLVAKLVAHFGGNIEFIHFEDDNGRAWETSRYSSLTLAVSPLSKDARIERDHGKTLEYELESLLGVAAVFRRSYEDFRNRFVRADPSLGAGKDGQNGGQPARPPARPRSRRPEPAYPPQP